MLPGENINEYYVRFHKLVNDIRNIRMTMPNIQLNSKFVNNMSPEWDSVQPYVQSAHVQSYQYPPSSTPLQSPHVQSLQFPQFAEKSHLDSGYTQTDEILDTLTKQVTLLAQSFRVNLPQTNNQLQTYSNTRNQATIQDAGNGGAHNRAGNANVGQGKLIRCYNCNGLGHIAQNLLDEEELLFLADECDALDSDVDDEPTAQSIFMANLSSTGPTNLQVGQSNASILSEVHDLKNTIDHCDDNQNEHETHNEVQQKHVIDSNGADMGNINVIPYEQYLTIN
ncbi:hypothetical protein Tco_0469151 [Tanacetum coccineum]